MKKVLIIGHFWPYRGGSRREIGLAKYLSEVGWEPIILTGSLDKKPDPRFRVIEVPCNDIFGFWRKFLKFFGIRPEKSASRQIKKKLGITSKKSFIDFLLRFYLTVFGYPDGFENWKPRAIKSASELFEKEKIDAIISIWPVSSHIIAKELKNKYKIPWVADFPDLWSQNYNYSYGPIRKLIDKRLEIKTILLADVLTAISWPMVENLKKIHKQEFISMITHGFDPEEVNKSPTGLTTKFTITYTGQIYTGKQDPLKILSALKDLISDEVLDLTDVELRFYGLENLWLEKEIEKHKLSDVVKQYGMIPRETSLKKQRESQILLLLKWEDPKTKGAYSGKVFEYLAAKRPILATGGTKDVVTDLLIETNAGIDAPSVKDIKNVLKELYLEYKCEGRVIYYGDIEKINKYSHVEMTKKFADILNRLTK